MNKVFSKSLTWSFAITTTFFTFIPEKVFEKNHCWIAEMITSFELISSSCSKTDVNIIYNRVLFFLVIFLGITILYWIYLTFMKSVRVIGKNYIITIKYGNIFSERNCKRVIPFDECFTNSVGDSVGDIKPSSLCGQYLQKMSGLNIEQLILESSLKPEKIKSKYQKRVRYKSGSIVQNRNDLLMAFAPLDGSGRGVFLSIKDYIDSLFTLWEELDKYYAQQDVCIPILGSGITRIGDGTDKTYSQQELLDIMIWSYKMSPYKIKKPSTLRIICREKDDFSLSKIEAF